MTTAATARTPEARVNSRPQLSSTYDLKEIARPKELNPSKFLPLLKRWIQRERIPLKYSDMFGESALKREQDPERIELHRSLMENLPIKKDELPMIPYLFPIQHADLKFKPPTMRFGWLITKDEIKALGLLKEEYVEDVFTDVYEPGDPKCPKDAKLDHETGYYYEFERKPVFSPSQTLDGLLDQAKVDCGLADDEHGDCCEYFRVSRIWNGHPQCSKDTLFITIFTNIDFLPQDPEKHLKGLKPKSDAIKRMQDWLGLEDREPGWWFSSTGTTPVTWEQYSIDGDL
ncbi:hypothetical protein BDY19DRAFT_995217 [Irpex rosettiformis]|uniref:Uncharacterized protein n=1 Tax=Irpex rosettiformis TaxID=378272 RepID=A0ACB8TYS7_9APHY|nr:hypothetical protein BDY19DRAFT_995217 [Irpex rosettiformis]